jgi:uncharacterized protein YjeT (DUF2065 family)
MPDWVLPGLGFALLLEGLLPMLAPAKWRQVFGEAMKLTDGQLRFLGVVSVGVGAGLLAVLA